jgi:hypothetical protein
MWICGFTMSQAIAQYERLLLLHHMDESPLGESSAAISLLAY